MKNLLQYCSENINCDTKTVQRLADSILKMIASEITQPPQLHLSYDLEIAAAPISMATEQSDLNTQSIRYRINFYRVSGSDIEVNEDHTPGIEIGLLELLQCRVGCMYLSDLHTSSNLPIIQHTVRKINPENYSLREWKDAVCYITGQLRDFDSCLDAANYLMTYTQTGKCPAQLK